jgi:Cys-tRNA(Pro)/Cys-tRNA(Cys) deacylase
MPARQTPATRALTAAKVPFELLEYDHDPGADSYALEAATALGLDPAAVLKTLVVDADGTLTVCLVPSGEQLDLRALGKRAAMAPPQRAEKVTGYVTGGISPFGQRRRLPTLVDESALAHATVYVSGGRRGLEIAVAPTDLVAVTDARTRPLARS